MSGNLIFEIYKDKRTVFNLQEIALLVNEPDFEKLKQRVHYYINTNKLSNPRKGIYTKEAFSLEELACKIYKPTYISLDYVLQKSGIVFQYGEQITSVCYLSRTIQIKKYTFQYRKIKNEILYNNQGITMEDTGINIATPERAILDTLYLNREAQFDTINSIDKELLISLLEIYQSKQLNKRVQYLLKNA